jgi:hypothetical protein
MARKTSDNPDPLHGGIVHVARTRGALSGVLLALLGAWGALIAFIGPAFSFGYSPDTSWHWSASRAWLEVLPGAVVFLGAMLLLLSANRIIASLGAWLALAGGVWFIVGTDFTELFKLGSVGTPLGASTGLRLLERLVLFDGLGALILFLAAGALGRLSVRSVRDVRTAQRREVEAEADRRRQDAYAESRRRQLSERGATANDDQGRPPEPRPADTGTNAGQPVGPGQSRASTQTQHDYSHDSATAWDEQQRPR